jgi:hypothetical protein
MTSKTPIAFFLVKFQGSNDEPMTVSEAEEMFTAAGRGTMNVVDWFDDNTHGHVDMTDNQVFGWLLLAQAVGDYEGSGANGQGRLDLISWARQAAAAAGIDLSPFTAVVVVTNVGVDLFGGAGFACCTAVTTGMQFWQIQAAPSVLCQEILHGLGVYEHARRHGSDADYADPYDVMSMFNASPGRSPTRANSPVGPGLNAAFMKRCGWLDATRGAPLGQVALRPLHRRDLPGPLYAVVGGYYVEYRASRRWDTGFPSVVLVHYVENQTSYLVAELRPGSPAFTWGEPLSPFASQGSIEVGAIDDAAETASITTSYREASAMPFAGPALSLFGTELGDGGGLIWLNGRIIKIPPRSPALRLAQTAAALVSIGELALTPALERAARAEVYGQTLAELGEGNAQITGVHSPLDHATAREAHELHREGGRK